MPTAYNSQERPYVAPELAPVYTNACRQTVGGLAGAYALALVSVITKNTLSSESVIPILSAASAVGCVGLSLGGRLQMNAIERRSQDLKSKVIG